MTPREACRLFRHQWDLVAGDWTPMAGYPVTQRCMRCDTEKRETYGTNSGELITRRYLYPPEYHYSRDEVPSGDELRLMFIHEQLARIRNDRKDRKRA